MHVNGVNILISIGCQLLPCGGFGRNPEETREYLDLTMVFRVSMLKEIRGTKVCRVEKSDNLYRFDTITYRECRNPH